MVRLIKKRFCYLIYSNLCFEINERNERERDGTKSYFFVLLFENNLVKRG